MAFSDIPINKPVFVYDEHSMTVLELLARMTTRVDKLDNAYDKLDETAERVVTESILNGKLTFGVYPSGDKTGATDRQRIQTCLDTWGACELNEGDYYLDASLTVNTGNTIRGRGQMNTRIHMVEDDSFVRIGRGGIVAREQQLNFSEYYAANKAYAANDLVLDKAVEIGKTYIVSWGGIEYPCTCTATTLGWYMGNPDVLLPGAVSDATEPFFFAANGNGVPVVKRETDPNTTITIYEAEGSADNLTLRDFCVTDGRLSPCFNLGGATTQPYTGARYSTFENIRVEGFTTGMWLTGAWCVNVKNCRFFTESSAVHHGGSCNNVVYDHCSFISIAGERFGMGAYIETLGGAQNCGISFFDCDFEGWETALEGYSVVSLNVKNIYAEGCDTVFNLNSCVGFNCDGGYAAYVKRLANVSSSNTATMYANGRGEIRNVFVRLETTGNHDTNNRAYLISGIDPRTYNLDVANVSAEDVDGNGCAIYFYNRDLNQNYGAGRDYPRSILASGTPETSGSTKKLTLPVRVPCGQRDHAKVVNIQLEILADYTPTAAKTLDVTLDGQNVWKFNLFANNAYKAGDKVNGTPTGPLILDLDGADKVLTVTNFTEPANVRLVATVVHGEMVASKHMK